MLLLVYSPFGDPVVPLRNEDNEAVNQKRTKESQWFKYPNCILWKGLPFPAESNIMEHSKVKSKGVPKASKQT
jgi:hypothetical protein